MDRRLAWAQSGGAGERGVRGGRRGLGRELFQLDSQVRFVMRFQLIGVNHKTAPVEVRERLAIPESRLPEACKKLAEHPGIDEAMILSTCNRVEILANTKNGVGADLRGFIQNYFQLDGTELNKHLYEYNEREAVRHLFRVAASLDSMVVG